MTRTAEDFFGSRTITIIYHHLSLTLSSDPLSALLDRSGKQRPIHSRDRTISLRCGSRDAGSTHFYSPSYQLIPILPMPRSVLVDVRTSAERVEDHIQNSLHLEYQVIDQLPELHNIAKDNHIDLYCRSGRRSAIALETLKTMGFTSLRDLGSIERARATLGSEQTKTRPVPPKPSDAATPKDLRSSHRKLLDGLREAGDD